MSGNYFSFLYTILIIILLKQTANKISSEGIMTSPISVSGRLSALNQYIKNMFLYLFLFFFLTFTIQDLFAIEVVSIGSACNVARASRHNNMRTTAYPLDWMITSTNALKNAFEDDFANILVPGEIHESVDNKSVIDGYGLIYIHDFPTIRYPIAPEDGEIMPVHGLASNWRDSISIVHTKFNRRLQRLLNLLHNGEPVALVRYNEMGRIEAEQFITLIQKKFPNAKAVLVVIGSTEEFKQSWNLPNVSNYYMEENEIRIWNGSAWTEVMQKIAALNPQGWETSFSKPVSYALTAPVYNPGLFCAFNMVLGALDYFDKGIISGLRIDFKEFGWYFDSEKGGNWWNYYFEPITLGANSANEEEQLFPTYQKIIFGYEALFEMSRERANELIQKYIHVLPHITKQVDDFCEEHFADSFVIGVHYRGTDKLEVDPVSYSTVAEHIQAAMIANKDKPMKIFVATDETRFANFIKEQFPSLVVMRDASRSDSVTGVHMRDDLKPYTKGEEAIIDCLLLSRCSLLIKMASHLSDSSCQFNPNIQVIKLNTSYSE